MATDFWASSHYKRWMVDRATLKRARAEDLQYVDDLEHLDFLAIYFANVITKLGKKLQLRQRAIATATVFFRRFYTKNSYCETDPFIVISACCYVAAKAEESPIHIKTVISESRALFSQENYNVKNFPSDNARLAEMEFYLVDDLDCDLTVFHPYRTLLALCKEPGDSLLSDSEEGEAEVVQVGVGIGAEDGLRYWGTGEGQLELTGAALQTAWFIINDTYRSDICLLYPPHLIAIAAIYLTFIIHFPAHTASSNRADSEGHHTDSGDHTKPRRSSRKANITAHSAETPKKPQDPIAFLSKLNVSLPLIATICQEILSLYALWDRYKEDSIPEVPKLSRDIAQSPMGSGSVSPTKRSEQMSRGESININAFSAGTTPSTDMKEEPGDMMTSEECITPSFLSALLVRMREAKLADLTHAMNNNRPVAVNKMLERTQAAG